MRGGSPAALILILLVISLPSAIHALPGGVSMGELKIEPRLLFQASRAPQNPLLDVYLLLDAPPTEQQMAELARFGTVRARVDTLVTMSLSLHRLGELAGLPYVQRVGGGRVYRLALDRSVPEMGADALWTQLRDAAGRPLRGAGLAIGIVDTGIDVRHRDFFFENGTSKILFIWDQTVSGRPPAGFPYGTEWTRRDVELGIAMTVDSHGHGTHVAGIAASSGLASGRWFGVAPDAGLIIVKSGRPACLGTSWSFEDTELMDALIYIWRKSREAGIRTVISLSLGGNLGGHDDTDPLEKLINRIVSDGIPVVVAAGNSGDEDIHARGRLAQGGTATISWVLDRDVTSAFVDIWHDPRDSLEVLVNTPDGSRVPGPTPPQGVVTPSGRVFIGRFPGEKGVNWQIEVVGSRPLPTSGWSLTLMGAEVRGSGLWDAYIDTDSCEAIRTGFTSFADRSGTIAVPATASKAIAVGAYVTLERITPGFAATLGPPGSLAPFSSRGPTRDGRVKPDITASGADIVSALSAQGIPLRRYMAFGGDATHVPLRGTSMAAPHVAGLATLLLQYDPGLTPEGLLQRIRAGARQDNHTGPIDPQTGSNLWGWGKADARGATGAFYSVTLEFQGLPAGIRVNVTVDGSPREALSDVGLKLWFIHGTAHTISVPEVVQVSPDVRYRAEGASFEVRGPGLLRILYRPQYLLLVRSNHLPEEARWVDGGTVVTLGPPSPPAPAPGVRFIFKGWVVEGAQPPRPEIQLVMDRPRVVEAVFIRQFYLNITSDAQEPPGEGWYDEGSRVLIQAPGMVEVAPGVRLVFSHWEVDGVRSMDAQLSITLRAPLRAHAVYKRQFLLTIVTERGSATGGGWYDEGSEASFSIATLRLGFPIQYVFVGWRGDYTGPSPTGRVWMDGPKRVEAVWAVDYTLLYLGLALGAALVGAGLLVARRRRGPAFKG